MLPWRRKPISTPNSTSSEPFMVRSPRPRPLPPPIAIIGLAILLAGDVALAALAWTALNAPLAIEPPTRVSDFELPQLPSRLDRAPIKENGGIALARPLFSPSRRPFRPPVIPAAPVALVQTPPPPAAPDLIVDGIWLQGEDKQAHLRGKDSDVGEWRTEGDRADGWRVKSITPSSVTVQSGGREVTLRLYPDLPNTQ
jgi:hypothetical protein